MRKLYFGMLLLLVTLLSFSATSESQAAEPTLAQVSFESLGSKLPSDAQPVYPGKIYCDTKEDAEVLGHAKTNAEVDALAKERCHIVKQAMYVQFEIGDADKIGPDTNQRTIDLGHRYFTDARGDVLMSDNPMFFVFFADR